MFENYAKIALRNIFKHKIVSLINILGLALGIAGCLIITIWILNELSYDSFHEGVDDIHMVLCQGTFLDNPSTPFPLAEALQREVPEIEYASRYQGISDALVSRGDRAFYEHEIYAVDPAFFDIFSYEFLEGDPRTALDGPRSAVITRSIAEKYFGRNPALGQVLSWNRSQEYTVTGVVAEPPGNTTLPFEILTPFDTYVRYLEATGRNPGWGFFSPSTFVRVHTATTREQAEEKISGFLTLHDPSEDARLSLLPFRERRAQFWNSGTYILIFTSIALFLLAVGCINYVNLSSAQSADRAVEISMRKVSGAGRGHLIAQLLSESILLTCFALVVALALVELLLPSIDARFNLNLSLDVIDPWFAVPALIALVLIVGTAAGALPAFVLSSFQPAKVFSGRLKSGVSHSLLRRILVIAQLAIAFFLMVGTQVIYAQMRYMTSMDIGYNKADLVEVPLRQLGGSHYQTLKAELLRSDNILGVTATAAGMPYSSWSTGTANWAGRDLDQDIHVFVNLVDYDFTETLQMELVVGRGFSREFPSDLIGGFVINEELAGLMGENTTVGTRLDMEGRTGEVIGIVKNFHYQPAMESIGPMALYLADDPSWIRSATIRLDPRDVAGSLQVLADTWARVLPDYPLEYTFLSEKIEAVYWQTSRLSTLATGFSVLAVFLAGLGMFGLASFTASRRSRELAIRKVFGGSALDIGLLLWREYAVCLAMACLMATPLAYLCMNRWVQSFAYRMPSGVATYFVALALVTGITLLAVSWQTVAAARRSPAVTLR
jgi:ABC-type antimicrobial peptide transport system permease subunit